MRLKGSGLIKKWTREFGPVWSQKCNEGSHLAAVTSFSLEQIAGVFVILGIGVVISTLVICVEIAYAKYKSIDVSTNENVDINNDVSTNENVDVNEEDIVTTEL